MKQIISGIGFFIIGSFFIGISLLGGIINISNITEWDSNTGKLFTSISDLNLYYFLIFGLIFILIGIGLNIWGLLKK